MGYPMTYCRVISRNGLTGNYTHLRDWSGEHLAEIGRSERELQTLRMICGDLRRLEADTIDGGYECQRIAEGAGVPVETVQKVLVAFFHGTPLMAPHDSCRGHAHVKGVCQSADSGG